jgi:hypothetical protein
MTITTINVHNSDCSKSLFGAEGLIWRPKKEWYDRDVLWPGDDDDDDSCQEMPKCRLWSYYH